MHTGETFTVLLLFDTDGIFPPPSRSLLWHWYSGNTVSVKQSWRYLRHPLKGMQGNFALFLYHWQLNAESKVMTILTRCNITLLHHPTFCWVKCRVLWFIYLSGVKENNFIFMDPFWDLRGTRHLDIIQCMHIFSMAMSSSELLAPGASFTSRVYLCQQRDWSMDTNFIYVKRHDVITHLFPTFNGVLAIAPLKLGQRMSNYITYKTMDGTTYPLTRYVKLQVAHAPGMSGTFFPATMG